MINKIVLHKEDLQIQFFIFDGLTMKKIFQIDEDLMSSNQKLDNMVRLMQQKLISKHKIKLGKFSNIKVSSYQVGKTK